LQSKSSPQLRPQITYEVLICTFLVIKCDDNNSELNDRNGSDMWKILYPTDSLEEENTVEILCKRKTEMMTWKSAARPSKGRC
jgi:hypothetical protein